MSSPVGPSCSPYQNFTDYNQEKTKKLSFDMIAMKNNAVSFAEGEFSVFQYIENILENEEFQKNPQAYLEAWSKRRGSSTISKFPEDYARPFFDEYFPKQENSCIIL
jgi:hypothetical protein